eukprot:6206177-Prymnesium_polylepis.1
MCCSANSVHASELHASWAAAVRTACDPTWLGTEELSVLGIPALVAAMGARSLRAAFLRCVWRLFRRCCGMDGG